MNFEHAFRCLGAYLMFFLAALGHPARLHALNQDPFHNLAVGVNYPGAQVHWGISEKWAIEGRYQSGKTDSDEGKLTAQLFGARIYRYLLPISKVRFFAGLELAGTKTSNANNSYATHGTATGAFIGMEYYLTRRLSIGIDVGPFYISSRVKNSNQTDSETTFVANSFMSFYLF